MKTAQGIRTVICLFSAFSILLLGLAWYASDLAPRLMYQNYRTVKYAAEMQGALTEIYLAAANAQAADPGQFARFDSNLLAEKNNLTEIGEPEIVTSLEAQWSAFRNLQRTPTLESFQKLTKTLEQLSAMNEVAMFAYESEARTLGKTVLFGGGLGFCLVLLYSIQVYLNAKLD